MVRRTSQTFPLLFVVMVVVVECVGPSFAMLAHTHVRDQQEALLTIAVNQMALLKEMNASSSVCASCESQIRELRMMKEEAMGHLEGMKEEVKSQLQSMEDEVRSRLQVMEREITEVREAIRNASQSQQPDRPPFLDIFHNDTNPSLCAPYKVLYGSKGSLSPSFPQFYQNNMHCEWRVILPDRTRPVFTWEYINIENCGSCNCDSVTVSAPDAEEPPKICAGIPPASHPMYNITNKEFRVVFTSDGSRTWRGFVLHYEAELAP